MINQQKPHLVILGIKVNSWAWGIERINQLSNSRKRIVVLDLGTITKSKKRTPRDIFQSQFLNQFHCDYIDWTKVLDKKKRKELLTQIKQWLENLQKNEKWIDEKFGNLPLGRIIMSNNARILGTKNFSIQLLSLSNQLKIAMQAVFAYETFRNLDLVFEEISISNGRSPIEAGVLFAARENAIPTKVLERGANTNEWFIWETSCHYSPDWWRLLNDVSFNDEIVAIAKNYWEKRLKGYDTLSNRDWSKEFDSGKLPKNLPNQFVTFFCTSEHESPALPEFECSHLGYPDQQAAVHQLVKTCGRLGVNLVIKRHPNSLSFDGIDRESRNWDWVKNLPNVFYIGPKDRIDSYSLINKSKAVLTFRSSVGIEAVALGVPSRALGPAEWASTEQSRIWNETDVERFIGNPTKLPNQFHLTWGYLASTFGSPLSVFNDITGGYAEYDGQKFHSNEFYLSKIQRIREKLERKIWSLRINYLRNIKSSF